jgi:hypothetical protein
VNLLNIRKDNILDSDFLYSMPYNSQMKDILQLEINTHHGNFNSARGVISNSVKALKADSFKYNSKISLAIMHINYLIGSSKFSQEQAMLVEDLKKIIQIKHELDRSNLIKSSMQGDAKLELLLRNPLFDAHMEKAMILYGVSRKMPPEEIHLLAWFWNENSKNGELIENFLSSHELARSENLKSLEAGRSLQLKSNSNTLAKTHLYEIISSSFMVSLYLSNIDSFNRLNYVFNEIHERCLMSNNQVHRDTISLLFGIEDVTSERWIAAQEAFQKEHEQRKVALETQRLVSSSEDGDLLTLDRELELLERVRGYSLRDKSTVYQKAEWHPRIEKNKINVPVERVICFQTREGLKAECRVRLDLSFLGVLETSQREDLIKFMITCDEQYVDNPKWIDNLNYECLPIEIKQILDEMAWLEDNRKRWLLKIIARFTSEINFQLPYSFLTLV